MTHRFIDIPPSRFAEHHCFVTASIQEIAFKVRGKPMKGKHWVMAAMRVSRVFPTLRLAAAWALAWGSHPPKQQMAQKVISSRIFKSRVPRV